MLIKSGSREDAIHSLINLWLKDKTLRCGWCGEVYNKILAPCCEQPFIGTNLDIFQQFYEEVKRNRGTRKNEYASTASKSMRWKLTFPPLMLEWLTKTFKRLYDEDLFNKEYGTTWFAKKFRKYFTMPERI